VLETPIYGYGGICILDVNATFHRRRPTKERKGTGRGKGGKRRESERGSGREECEWIRPSSGGN